MINKICLITTPACTNAALIKSAAGHPLHLETRRVCRRGHEGEIVTICLGAGVQDYATLVFQHAPDGDTRLRSVEGNLANLVHGHGGRLIKSQAEMELGLTRLRSLAAPFVSARDVHLILPSLHPENEGFIESIEIPVQVSDPDRVLFQAASYSRVKKSATSPTFIGGESVLLRGRGVDWKITDMQSQLDVKRIMPGTDIGTRIECHIHKGIEITKSTGVPRPEALLTAAVSFDHLWAMLNRTIKNTLRGGLAKPPRAPDSLRLGARNVLEHSGDPLSTHSQLLLQTGWYTEQESERIRQQVFDQIAWESPISLSGALGESYPYPQLKEIERPAAEAEHQRRVAELGWANTPDIDISGTFSGALYLDSDDSSRKSFFPNTRR